MTRRKALCGLAGFLAGSPLLRGQQDPFRDHSRVPALNELLTTFDFEPVCYAKVPREYYDYMAYAEQGEFTLRRNREAFDWVHLVPRGVVNVSAVQTGTEVLGTKMSFPILVSPTGFQGQLHPQGEVAMHQGATAASGTPMLVSSAPTLPFEKIGAAASGPLWFQLYAREDFDSTRELLDQAQALGYRAVAMTVDQTASYYERALHDRHLGVGAPGSSRFATAGFARARQTGPRNPYRVADDRLWYNWQFVEKLKGSLEVPLLLKGILTAEDAKLCLEHGVDGIIVSNHGGRSMDYTPSSIEALPEVVDAVQGRIPVLIDSGFRRGADVLKALALGAKAVCFGRVTRWGLGAYGPAGVQRVLEILQGELVLAMAHAGRPTLASIDRTLARAEFP
jgi:4-hydroxymandelate oxidase